MSEITLAVSSWVCKYPDDIKTIATNTEFKAIEWDLNYIPVSLSHTRRIQLRNDFEQLGILLRYHLPYSTCDIGSLDSRIRKISEKYLSLNLELIHELGADHAVLHFAAYNDEKVPPLDSLKRIAEIALKLDIVLMLENLTVGPTSNPVTLKQIALDSGVKVAFDVGHAIAGKGLLNLLDTIAPIVSHVHFYGYEDQCRNHLPFNHDEDAIATAKIIQKTCNAKWWTIEMDSLDSCIKTHKIVQGIGGSKTFI